LDGKVAHNELALGFRLKDAKIMRRPQTYKPALCRVVLLTATFAALAVLPATIPADREPSPIVAPQATAAPIIASINPAECAAGKKVKVTITGQNFASGAYVAFSNPALRALSTHASGNGKITVEVQVAPEAPPGAVTLYVTNPSGAFAGVTFTVRGAALNGSSAAGSQPAAEKAKPASKAGTPVVSKVMPASAGPGSNFILTLKGENFAPGARIAFSNPNITVGEATVKSKTELTAPVQIAQGAASGVTGLFVINPDLSEVESRFEVSGAAIQTATKKASSPSSVASGAKSKKSSSNANAVSFGVFNLGDVAQVLKTGSKVRGTLSVANGVLTYVENGTQIFSVPAREVQEIAPNVFFGLNTGTFHIFLSSGKHYNFAASSLNPADTQKIETQLQAALK
jgi:hypothetical protein